MDTKSKSSNKDRLTPCLKISLYTFLANMDAAESTEESAEDITAAETAPSPKKAIILKKYCVISGLKKV